jgi:hypothetical protein
MEKFFLCGIISHFGLLDVIGFVLKFVKEFLQVLLING